MTSLSAAANLEPHILNSGNQIGKYKPGEGDLSPPLISGVRSLPVIHESASGECGYLLAPLGTKDLTSLYLSISFSPSGYFGKRGENPPLPRNCIR